MAQSRWTIEQLREMTDDALIDLVFRHRTSRKKLQIKEIIPGGVKAVSMDGTAESIIIREDEEVILSDNDTFS